MVRSKVKHELISHEPSRRITSKKRTASLFRKLKEITTLCGVIASSLYDGSDNKSDVWRSPEEAFPIIEEFQKLPAKGKGQFMMNQKAFLKKNISKLNGQVERVRSKVQQLDEKLLLLEYVEGKNLRNTNRLESLIGLYHDLDRRVDFITKRLVALEGLEATQVDSEMDSDDMMDHGIKTGVVDENQC